MIFQNDVLAIVLAGGEGTRMMPVTQDRAKPAVPFAGSYRLIDFVLSNLANAGYLRVLVLTQYKSHSLERHISDAWSLPSNLGTFVIPVSAQMRVGPHWFQGSADAVFQNLHMVTDERPSYVCVFSADHIYRMDPRHMVEQHRQSGASLTISAVPVPRHEASAFGIIEPAAGRIVRKFWEKPTDPPVWDLHPDLCLASMGNYVFDVELLHQALEEDAADTTSTHDLGRDVIPRIVERGDAEFYDFRENEVPGEPPADRGYWRDVGTLDAYYEANMELLAPVPRLNLYLDSWPIHTAQRNLAPVKLVTGRWGGRGQVSESLVCLGTIVSGATITWSVVGPQTFVDDGASLDGCVVFGDSSVGAGSLLRHCIIDKHVTIPPGTRIGVDKEEDACRGFTVSDKGVTVVPRGYTFG